MILGENLGLRIVRGWGCIMCFLGSKESSVLKYIDLIKERWFCYDMTGGVCSCTEVRVFVVTGGAWVLYCTPLLYQYSTFRFGSM